MANRYKYYSELKFGVAKVEPGPISFSDLYEFATEMRNDKRFPDMKFHLTDLRGVNFEFHLEKLSEMKELLEKFDTGSTGKIGVYLVDLPNETAFIHFFLNALVRNRDYCISVEKAYEILDLPVSLEEFKKIIVI